MNLLIVSDLVFIRNYIKRIITAKYNFDIYEAHNYNDAKELIKRYPFHVIISEYLIDNEVCFELIKTAKNKNEVYFILLKTNTIPISEYAPDYVLHKPFKPEDICQAIDEFFKYKPRAKRYDFNIPACIEVFGIHITDVEIINVSKTGALLSCPQSLHYKDFVLRVRNKKIRSRVARISKNDGQWFYGVAFGKYLSDNELNEILLNHSEYKMSFSFVNDKI